MKKMVFVTFLLCSFWSSGHSQCFQDRMILIEDSLTRHTLLDYIHDALQNHFAYFDKGIFSIVRYTDRQNRRCLWIKTWIDDRYKDTQPTNWGYLASRIVLLYYDGDADGKIIPQPIDQEFMECLEKIVADRVYIRPPKTTRYILERNMKNELIIKEDLNIWHKLGNDSNECIFIFEKDGKVTKLRPV